LRKVGTRRAQAIAKVALAGLAKTSGGVVKWARIALASVAPIPIRCAQTEAVLVGRKIDRTAIEEAKAKIALEIAPISDIRSTQDYRRRVTVNLLQEFLETLLA
jgi:CO/xanthine dehydrogenase FAD-binding subunit